MSKESLPLVSVITPVLNRAHSIQPALLSAMQQEYPNMEFIVVNDGSTDQTIQAVEALQKQDARITLINNPKNVGISRSRNIGMAQAQGDIFAVLDSDDIWIRKDKIKKQVEFLEANPEVGILGTNHIVQENGRFHASKHILTDEAIRGEILKWTPFLHSSVVYPRQVYDKIGGYRPDIKYADDRAYRLEAGKFFTFANLSDYTVLYHSHPDNVSHQYWRKQGIESLKLSYQYCLDYPNALPCITEKIYLKIRSMLIRALDEYLPGSKAALKQLLGRYKSTLTTSDIAHLGVQIDMISAQHQWK